MLITYLSNLCPTLSFTQDPITKYISIRHNNIVIGMALPDEEGERIFADKDLSAFWNEAEDKNIVPVVISNIRGKLHWFNLYHNALTAIVFIGDDKVELYYKGYRPIEELGEGILKAKKVWC